MSSPSRIIVKCSGCKTKYKLRGELAGKKVVCRTCQQPILVQAPDPDTDEIVVEIDDFEAEVDFDDEFAAPPPPPVKQRNPAPALGKLKPVRKKSAARPDAKSDDSGASSANRLIIAMVAGAVLMLVALAAFIVPKVIGRARASSAIEAPAAFFQYQEPGAAVWCECPEGWEVTKGGGSGGVPGWVRIKSKKISVSIRDSSTGTSIGTIANPNARSSGPDDEKPPELEPVHVVHMFRLSVLQAENAGYEETEPEVFTTQMGKARLAEFTKPVTFGKMYGYRCTLPPGVNQYNVTCECTQAEFEVLKDTFRRIIASCQRGSG